MIIALLSTVLVLSWTLIYLYLVRNFDYWTKRKVVGPSPTVIFGNIKEIALLRLTQAECLQNIYKKYWNEKYVGMFQLSTPTLLLLDPQMIKQILIKDFQYFTDRGFPYDEEKEPLTANLVNLEGVKWRVLRQKLTPTFSSGKIRNMMPLLHECGEQLMLYMQEIMKQGSTDMEMRELTAKYTTDVIGSCAFGLQFNSMSSESSEFRRMGHRALKPSTFTTVSKLIRVFSPLLFRLLNLRTFPKEVNDFFLSVVADIMQQRRESHTYREDFLQLLAELKDSNDTPESERQNVEITDKLIAAQAFVFFLAGFETSSTTLSFCLHELAVNPTAQETALVEIKRCIDRFGLPFNHDALKEMTYLEQCLNETMRKYPPVQALARVCTKQYKIPGTSIELDEGTAILIPVYAIHHDSRYYDQPESFIPERFCKTNQLEKQTGIYMPFGDGPRTCIGLRFAMIEMKLALATFLASYEVKPSPKTEHPLQLEPAAFILAPKAGIWLNVTPRSNL